MERRTLIITILFIVTGVLYYIWTAEPTVLKPAEISRIVDGDTVETADEILIRLKGINTPEKGEIYYSEARNYLESLILNQTIEFEDYGPDTYGRTLAHIYIGEKYVNGEMVRQGLALWYPYGKEDSHDSELENLEEAARNKELGLWERSKDYGCLELIELKYEEDGGRCIDGELLKIRNSCDKDFNVVIKDDATHIYNEIIDEESTFTRTFSCIFNDDGDSLYVWDSDGLLIFYRY